MRLILPSETLRTLPGTVARILADAVLPPLCPSCKVIVDRPYSLCLPCWSALTFISDPMCRICGDPFEIAPPGDLVCGACLAEPPLWHAARSAVRYDEASRALILGFKHGDRLHLSALFAGWMRIAGAGLLEPGAVLVPVPLHRWRLLSRRYNQSALLAYDLARKTGLRVSDQALIRTRATDVQGKLSATQRRKNVAGAFKVSDARRSEIAGRSIILIDDVRTSGATAAACTRTLLRAGAARVSFLTIARVLR